MVEAHNYLLLRLRTGNNRLDIEGGLPKQSRNYWRYPSDIHGVIGTSLCNAKCAIYKLENESESRDLIGNCSNPYPYVMLINW